MVIKTANLLVGRLSIILFILLFLEIAACNSFVGLEEYKDSNQGISFLYPGEFDIREETVFNKPCSTIFFGENDDVRCISIKLGRTDQEIWDVTVETFSNDLLSLNGLDMLGLYVDFMKINLGEDHVTLLRENMEDESNSMPRSSTIILNVDNIVIQPQQTTWVSQHAIKLIEGENRSAIIVGQTITTRHSTDIDPTLQTIIENFEFDEIIAESP